MRIVVVQGYHFLHGHTSINISPSLALPRSSPTGLSLTRWILKFLHHVVRNESSSTAALAPVETISIFLAVHLYDKILY